MDSRQNRTLATNSQTTRNYYYKHDPKSKSAQNKVPVIPKEQPKRSGRNRDGAVDCGGPACQPQYQTGLG